MEILHPAQKRHRARTRARPPTPPPSATWTPALWPRAPAPTSFLQISPFLLGNRGAGGTSTGHSYWGNYLLLHSIMKSCEVKGFKRLAQMGRGDTPGFSTAKGGAFINDPLIVVSVHFKSCVRQCSPTNPSSNMRPDNISTVSQVAPRGCLLSSTCQFGNGTPRSTNLLGNFQTSAAAT